MESWAKVKPWQGEYVVLLKPHTIITATSDAYLTELLSRIDNGLARRALTDDLPEWKHVDTSAEAWLLRHLPAKSPQAHLFSGPQRLRGLVWMVYADKSPEYQAIYLPIPGQRVDDIARRPWVMPNEAKIPGELAAILDFQTAPDGTVTFTFPRVFEKADKAEMERTRQLLEQLADSPGKVRLLVFSMFYLHRTQGIWR
ncbi:MAG: hypothetical protein ACYTG0_46605, partial [Planctomycetota bacterium]|jgi:hypothetical protein